jgi:plastocyanin
VNRRMHFVWVVAIATALVVAAGMGAAQARAGVTVKIIGGTVFEPNALIGETQRYSPGSVTVRRGEEVAWLNRTRQPHTITVVPRRMVPDTLAEMNRCEGCVFALGHLTDPENPETSPIKDVRLDRGRRGFNTQGDSLFVTPRRRSSALFSQRMTARVTAKAGRTLFYICAIHPWMQGSIHVLPAG